MKLDELRSDISAIDAQLAPLFSERMRLSAEIGKMKKDAALPISDTAREASVMQSVRSLVSDTHAENIGVLYAVLFEISKHCQLGDGAVGGDALQCVRIELTLKGTEMSLLRILTHLCLSRVKVRDLQFSENACSMEITVGENALHSLLPAFEMHADNLHCEVMA